MLSEYVWLSILLLIAPNKTYGSECSYAAADGASCTAAGPGGTAHADSSSDLDCTNDEEASYCQQGDYIFQWVCTPVVCNIVYNYGNSSLSYYFDPVCRKCVPCLVGQCPTLAVTGDSDYCYEDTTVCSDDASINCGQHGELCSCYQCSCDDGWATDWGNTAAGYCNKDVSGELINTPAPIEDGGISTTTIWIIIVSISAFVVVVAMIVCCVCIFRKKNSTVKLRDMMEDFQANALEKQRKDLERRNGIPQIHARSTEDHLTCDENDMSRDSGVPLTDLSTASIQMQSSTSNIKAQTWLLQYCNEYQTDTSNIEGKTQESTASQKTSEREPAPCVVPKIDPLIVQPGFKRQDTATLNSNSPTQSLFPASPVKRSNQNISLASNATDVQHVSNRLKP